MENKIKSENKKALPKFLGIMVLCGLIGGVLGFLGVTVGEVVAENNLIPWLKAAMEPLLLWLIPGVTVFTIVFSVIMEYSAQKMKKSWDGENEEVSDQIEKKIGLLMLVQGMAMPVSYMSFSIAFVYLEPGLKFMVLGGELLVFIIVYMYLQKRAVDFVKIMNPEKQGSVFDFNFQKKWKNSCDEAERQLMGEAALTTFMVMAHICAFLWAGLFFAHIIFNVGLLPMILVLLLWMISQIVYQVKVMQLSKHR